MGNGVEGVLVYDGSCAFCTRSAHWISSRWPPSSACSAVPFQQLGAVRLAALGLTVDDVSRAAWWVADGRPSGGHVAVARSLIAARGSWKVLGHLLLVPPVRWLAAIGYRIVAANRSRLPGHTSACGA